MIAYFGKDDRGYYVDPEGAPRQYVTEAQWLEFVRAAAVSPPENGEAVKLSITEHVVLDKFDGEVSELPADPTSHPAHRERLVIQPETLSGD